jgi:hypothetical protein
LFKGRLPHALVPEYLSCSDVFVLPTLAEGCSNAIVEAMACGLPIISSNLPFNTDILDESNAILIDPMKVEEIAKAIQVLRLNAKIKEKYIENSIEKVKRLSIEGFVTAYYILFIMIFIASIQEAFKKDKILYAYWKFFILLFLWFIIGGRYEGVDYYGYVGYFNNAPPFKSYFISFNQFISYFSSYVEFGFLFLMSLSKVLGFEFHHFLLVFSFFIVFLRYKAINKSTQFIITAILIYMGTGFIYDMGQIRNSLSSVLVLNAVLEYADGKTRKGIFLTVIASLIHMVSIVAFIIPLLIRLEKKLVVYLFLLSLIIAIFYL